MSDSFWVFSPESSRFAVSLDRSSSSEVGGDRFWFCEFLILLPFSLCPGDGSEANPVWDLT